MENQCQYHPCMKLKVLAQLGIEKPVECQQSHQQCEEYCRIETSPRQPILERGIN
ncbi:MAG: hypothetical protein WC438_04420 [Candidatus Pacearchaeota archaeon]